MLWASCQRLGTSNGDPNPTTNCLQNVDGGNGECVGKMDNL